MKRERIDKLLVERGLALSRTKAQALVMAGVVLVNNQRVNKPSEMFEVDAPIRIKGEGDPASRYVRRGGLKMEAALKEFKMDVTGFVCLDVGASTGGFTDCLLQHGARRVVAVDVGHNQMDWRLRRDARVEVREGVNARYLKPEDFEEKFDLAVMDVSFISATKVLPAIVPLLTTRARLVTLIKPQFEVGRGEDVRGALTPELRTDIDDTALVLVDLGGGRDRLGGSVLAQVFGQQGGDPPDVDDHHALKRFFDGIQALNREGRILAYHDRSDGGLLATACEMAFAARCGLALDLGAQCGDALAALFSEELGAVLQVRLADLDAVAARLEGIAVHRIGKVTRDGRIAIRAGDTVLVDEPRATLHCTWSSLTHRMQALRDDPAAADDEYARLHNSDDPGVAPVLTFDPAEDIAAPLVASGVWPAIAILREQGVNGQVEMAAAFDRAGFAAFDVHMSDIIAGRVTLDRFVGIAACGGFSYGDVLGAGEGWAKSILFNARARDQFAAFFARGDTFALGVCNGCQMMSNLHEIIPGTAHWPHFVGNRSEQFEARLTTVEIGRTPSLFFAGMAGSRLTVATAHGEGLAEFRDDAQAALAEPLVCWRFVDNRGNVTERYPFNANGSPRGVTGLTTADGRFTIVMPHPERVFRNVQLSWRPRAWLEAGDASPWLRMFRNARRAVG